MTYWLSMGSVLLVGYCLIKWSGRADEQENEGSSGVSDTTITGQLDTRSPATVNAKEQASNLSTYQGNYGGKA